MNEWMNNLRQDDSNFMINIPAYSCCVWQYFSQRLWHVSKDGLLNEPRGQGALKLKSLHEVITSISQQAKDYESEQI